MFEQNPRQKAGVLLPVGENERELRFLKIVEAVLFLYPELFCDMLLRGIEVSLVWNGDKGRR